MKKNIYIIFMFIIFFTFSSYVKAARGDLIYDINDVYVNSDKITLSGYAFIHKTQNYVTVYKRTNESPYVTDEVLLKDGGQKVSIVVAKCDYNKKSCYSDPNNYIKVDYDCKDDKDSSNKADFNYNFYYQQFYNKESEYSVNAYNNPIGITNCDVGETESGKASQCYYEDVSFKIDIKIADLLGKFSYGDELKVFIAASNNDFKNRSGNEYTDYKELKIPDVVLSDTDYIDFVDRFDIESDILRNLGKAEFIASQAVFKKHYTDQSSIESGFYGCTKPNSLDPERGSVSWCGSSFTERVENSAYHIIKNDAGTIKYDASNVGLVRQNFLNDTNGPGMYAMCVDKDDRIDACSETDEHGFCKQCNETGSQLSYAYGSWLSFSDVNLLRFKIKDIKRCEYDPPSDIPLECNNIKTLESTCDELTIVADVGTATVKIEQIGTVSSVLTPDRTFAGGGFNFDVMYQNNIKWSYVSRAPKYGVSDSVFNAAIKSIMEDKIKNYNEYTSGININSIKMDDKFYTGGLEKKCFSSVDASNKDYYGDGITVTCIFTFPEATLNYDGSVSYASASNKINVNNKFYTPTYYNGNYKLEANIVGMNRITDNAAKSDGKDGKSWTGNWNDTFENCEINLYPLLYDYRFIYRPIDLYNPFPNRNAGINWYEWYKIAANKARLENSYSKLEYTATLNNSNIAEIKNYNKDNSYLDWSNIESGKSSFITENDYIVRESGS